MTSIKNNRVSIEYFKDSDKPYILYRDLRDTYNETTGYTRNTRNLSKAWEFISIIFNKYELKEDLSFNDIDKLLNDKFNLKTRIYCAMD